MSLSDGNTKDEEMYNERSRKISRDVLFAEIFLMHARCFQRDLAKKCLSKKCLARCFLFKKYLTFTASLSNYIFKLNCKPLNILRGCDIMAVK